VKRSLYTFCIMKKTSSELPPPAVEPADCKSSGVKSFNYMLLSVNIEDWIYSIASFKLNLIAFIVPLAGSCLK
jgi:hypothetical protein